MYCYVFENHNLVLLIISIMLLTCKHININCSCLLINDMNRICFVVAEGFLEDALKLKSNNYDDDEK